MQPKHYQSAHGCSATITWKKNSYAHTTGDEAWQLFIPQKKSRQLASKSQVFKGVDQSI